MTEGAHPPQYCGDGPWIPFQNNKPCSLLSINPQQFISGGLYQCCYRLVSYAAVNTSSTSGTTMLSYLKLASISSVSPLLPKNPLTWNKHVRILPRTSGSGLVFSEAELSENQPWVETEICFINGCAWTFFQQENMTHRHFHNYYEVI